MSPERKVPGSPVADDSSGSVSNVEVALKILDRLGGAEKFVDIEDVAAEGFALAPDRFGWRTRPWASWERVRSAFVHANQQSRGRGQPRLVVSSRGGESWRLTAEGVSMARSTSRAEGVELTHPALPPRRGSVRSAERVRQIRRHRAFLLFASGTPVHEIERYVLADLLLCPPDSSRSAVRRKVDLAKAAALDAGDRDVLQLLDKIEAEVDQLWS